MLEFALSWEMAEETTGPAVKKVSDEDWRLFEEFMERRQSKRSRPDDPQDGRPQKHGRPGLMERQMGELLGYLRQQARQPAASPPAFSSSIFNKPVASSTLESQILMEIAQKIEALQVKVDQMTFTVQMLQRSLRTSAPASTAQGIFRQYFDCAFATPPHRHVDITVAFAMWWGVGSHSGPTPPVQPKGSPHGGALRV